MCEINFNINCIILLPNPRFNHLLESSRRDDSNKWSNIGLGHEIGILEIELHKLSEAPRKHLLSKTK